MTSTHGPRRKGRKESDEGEDAPRMRGYYPASGRRMPDHATKNGEKPKKFDGGGGRKAKVSFLYPWGGGISSASRRSPLRRRFEKKKGKNRRLETGWNPWENCFFPLQPCHVAGNIHRKTNVREGSHDTKKGKEKTLARGRERPRDWGKKVKPEAQPVGSAIGGRMGFSVLTVGEGTACEKGRNLHAGVGGSFLFRVLG